MDRPRRGRARRWGRIQGTAIRRRRRRDRLRDAACLAAARVRERGRGRAGELGLLSDGSPACRRRGRAGQRRVDRRRSPAKGRDTGSMERADSASWPRGSSEPVPAASRSWSPSSGSPSATRQTSTRLGRARGQRPDDDSSLTFGFAATIDRPAAVPATVTALARPRRTVRPGPSIPANRADPRRR